MAATYEPIATTTLSSAASSITFSSIASSWTDLRVVLVAKATPSAAINVRFNADSGSNYSQTTLYGNGSSAGSQRGTSNSSIEASYNGPDSTIPMLWTMDVFSYAGSTYKTVLCTESSDSNGSGATSQVVGLWRSTSAITEVYIWMNSLIRLFSAGTTATLYGIKAA